MLDAPVAIADRPAPSTSSTPAGRVELDHVSFRYPPAAEVSIASLETPRGAPSCSDAEPVEVLHDVDLVIEPGQMVALVGPSGAGKTTIASLVPRLYDVTGGAVRIDGTTCATSPRRRSAPPSAWSPGPAPVPRVDRRQPALRQARRDGRAELEAACRAAQIHDVIAALPDGYDTVVGERGYRLSGGEKQRLAIARMLLKDPAIVILDEATSHLDTENEALVQAALDRALQGRTSIVIAHRLSTIRRRRPDLRGRRRAHRRAGHARRAPRSGRPLRRAVPHAGPRLS